MFSDKTMRIMFPKLLTWKIKRDVENISAPLRFFLSFMKQYSEDMQKLSKKYR